MTAVILQFAPMTRKKRDMPAPPNRIRELREAKGITQAAMAETIGTKANVISRLETGDRELTMGWLKKIARLLGVAPGDLFSFEDQGLSADERMIVDAVRSDERTARMITATAREAMVPPALALPADAANDRSA